MKPTSTLTTLSTAHDGDCRQELLAGVCTLQQHSPLVPSLGRLRSSVPSILALHSAASV